MDTRAPVVADDPGTAIVSDGPGSAGGEEPYLDADVVDWLDDAMRVQHVLFGAWQLYSRFLDVPGMTPTTYPDEEGLQELNRVTTASLYMCRVARMVRARLPTPESVPCLWRAAWDMLCVVMHQYDTLVRNFEIVDLHRYADLRFESRKGGDPCDGTLVLPDDDGIVDERPGEYWPFEAEVARDREERERRVAAARAKMVDYRSMPEEEMLEITDVKGFELPLYDLCRPEEFLRRLRESTDTDWESMLPPIRRYEVHPGLYRLYKGWFGLRVPDGSDDEEDESTWSSEICAVDTRDHALQVAYHRVVGIKRDLLHWLRPEEQEDKRRESRGAREERWAREAEERAVVRREVEAREEEQRRVEEERRVERRREAREERERDERERAAVRREMEEEEEDVQRLREGQWDEEEGVGRGRGP